MVMELEHLRSFLALAGQLHFARTARLLNVSQPALTKRIRQLESEIGGQLFHRRRNGTRLTDLGGLLRVEAGKLVLLADQLLNDMRRATRGEIGKLSIGFGFHTFELVPRIVVPHRLRVVAEIVEALPDAAQRSRPGLGELVLAEVDQGRVVQVDAGLVGHEVAHQWVAVQQAVHLPQGPSLQQPRGELVVQEHVPEQLDMVAVLA